MLVTAEVKAVETKARKKFQLGKARLKAVWKNQEKKRQNSVIKSFEVNFLYQNSM